MILRAQIATSLSGLTMLLRTK